MSDETIFLPMLIRIFLSDIGQETSSTDIDKQNLDDVGQNILPIDVDKKKS